jgi:hypothetical protein
MDSSTKRGRRILRAGPGSDRSRGSGAARHGRTSVSLAAVNASALASSVLIELSRAQIPPEIFTDVLLAFGQLSEHAQCDLALRLTGASQVYRLRKSIEKQGFPLPHEKRRRLGNIGTSAKRLLALLGVNEPESVAGGVRLDSVLLHPVTTKYLMTGLYRIAAERRPGITTAGAEEQLATLIVLLSDLVETAVRAAFETKTTKRTGVERGGQDQRQRFI